jgi:hypothetical protein
LGLKGHLPKAECYLIGAEILMQTIYLCKVLHLKRNAMTKFNAAQLEIIKMFDQDLSAQEVEKLRKMLSKFLAEKLRDEVTRVWDEKGYTDEFFENLHERTPYQKK